MKKNGEMFKNLALISQLGISMMVPVFVGVGIGLLIDKHFNTMFSVVGLILGIIAGYRNTYLIVKDTMDKAVAKKTDEDIADEEAMKKIQEMHESTVSTRRKGGVYLNVNADDEDSDADKGE